MKILTDIWEWLNGNKTLIGAVILTVLSRGLIPEGTLFSILDILGQFLVGGGLVHKFIKGKENT